MQSTGGPYLGNVTRITSDGAYVICQQLSGSSELGPAPMLINFRISDQDSAGLKEGDTVLVTCVDNYKDKIAILGVLTTPAAPIVAPPAGSWPGW